ncbi:MAG: hypothetical protein JWO00_347 [Candidatus Parcubacteria bacterium]|nr:hypothetical protein [Candidatus Parcubacteria bacterium]
MKRRNRSSLYSILSSPFTLIAAVIVFIVLARAAWSIHEKARESSLRLEVATAELARLQSSQAELGARVDQLSTPAGIRFQIRERYHAVEPGEQVAVIVDSLPSASGTAAAINAASTTGAQGSSWWRNVLHAFGL